MRKNKFMRAASGLLVAVLLTTCVISGTFAKYITSYDGSDKARVAKWGFQSTSAITLTGLFKDAYDGSVKANTDVIAPGTSNEAQFGFNYGGADTNNTVDDVDAPEVKYTFKVDTDGSTCADDIKNNTNIVWYLDGKACTSWDNLLSEIEKLSGATDGTDTATYDPGQLPSAFNQNTANLHTVKWEWKFDKSKTGAADLDTKDTEMGNKTALDEVTLKIAITATQVD